MRKTLLLLIFQCSLIGLFANNIMVSNVSLTGQNTVDGFTLVQFDLSWENSWRVSVGPSNWDAAWVFVKYRVNGDNWRHATLNYVDGSSDGHTAPAGATINTVSNETGVFVYRSADGSGDVNYQNIQLRWNYDEDNVDQNALVDIQVFAIEMVYVPQGSFRVGTGFLGTEIDQFYTLGNIIAIRSPYLIANEDAITIAFGVGTLYYDATSDGGDQLGPVPAAFPKGFDAFYCQKYETSQDQWVSFFNTLSPNQKENLDITGPDGKNSDDVFIRNGISWADAGSATTSLPDVPMNYIRNTFVYAYLDWAGLRPMTEFEYEKACRGPLNTVAGEYAWGNTNIHAVAYTLVNDDTPSEQISNPGAGTGNVSYLETVSGGPYRCGIFAASAITNNREETGGSYYGIMELSGNVYERAITIGNPEGRAFTGNHGDGTISAGGTANVAAWPTGNAGIGYRGGGYPNATTFIRVSDRNDAANSFSGTNGRIGFRGVRTAE